VPPSPPEEPAPFARRVELGRFSAFAQTWKLASLEPQRFFRSVRVDRPWSAVLFGVVAVTVSQWFDAAYNYLIGASMLGVIEQLMQSAPSASFDPGWIRIMFGVPVLLGRVLAAPVVAFAGLYLTAALFHLILLVFRGAGRGFDATLTAVGYASGVLLLGAVPMCGGLVASIWFLVLAIIGLAEVQRCGPGKAAAAVFLPGLLFCLCCCGGLLTFLGTLRGIISQHTGVEL
jgi:hypothetical protein